MHLRAVEEFLQLFAIYFAIFLPRLAQMLFSSPNDVINCYRLLLLRSPDDPGLKNFSTLIASGKHPLEDLVALFLKSPEFMAHQARRQNKSQRLSEVDLPGARNNIRMVVAPDWNGINAEIALTRAYEPHITQHLTRHIKSGTGFADIGANIGYFSMIAASMGATVWAFEPNARNLWLLSKNARLNNFPISVMPYALADSERLMIYDPLDGNGAISNLSDAHPPAEGQEIVRTRTLDEAIGASKIDIIKIDVEGAEALVLKGASQVLKSRPIVFSEFFPGGIQSVSGIDPISYLALFVNYDYSVIREDGTIESMSAPQVLNAANASAKGFVDIMATPR
jgi:FkbM family methyltransferase